MEMIVALRYAPLTLPQLLNVLSQGDYLKYFPRFTREGDDDTVEEHLALFYNHADNQNVKHEDVWTKLFVQSLDGEARKWFQGLIPWSIAGVEALDEALLKQ